MTFSGFSVTDQEPKLPGAHSGKAAPVDANTVASQSPRRAAVGRWDDRLWFLEWLSFSCVQSLIGDSQRTGML